MNPLADCRPTPAHPGQDRRFLWLLGGAVALRLGVALGLWLAVILWGSHPPLEVLSHHLRSLDAHTYHVDAMRLMEWWQAPEAQRETLEIPWFSVLMALVYLAAGPHPLLVVALGCLTYLGTGWCAYALAARLGHPAMARRGLALLICLWPPSLAWSVVPMKEPLLTLAVFAFLHFWLGLIHDLGRGRAWRLGVMAGLLAGVAVMCALRFYLWNLLWLVALGPVLGRLWPRPAVTTEESPGWARLVGGLALLAAALMVCAPLRDSAPPVFARTISATALALAPWTPTPALAGSPGDGPAPAATPPEPDPVLSLPSSDWAPTWLLRAARHLGGLRRQFATFGGESLAPEAGPAGLNPRLEYEFISFDRALSTLGRLGWATGRDLLLFPYPWQSWPAEQGWRPVSILVSLQQVLWYLMIPCLIVGAWRGLGRRPTMVLPLLWWALVIGLVLGLVIVNRGTLYRIRDMALLPIVLLVDPRPYAWLWRGRSPGRPPGRA